MFLLHIVLARKDIRGATSKNTFHITIKSFEIVWNCFLYLIRGAGSSVFVVFPSSCVKLKKKYFFGRRGGAFQDMFLCKINNSCLQSFFRCCRVVMTSKLEIFEGCYKIHFLKHPDPLTSKESIYIKEIFHS